ncbi:MAG TPA: nucleotidyl transferase AbiEii/AbiGii toxin family protein [Kofleriaceae bacterium]|nr:nucleotidyl transferase AbiEii/AbiGii toxin family protein [Kofleriaceae bacterium]
MKPLKDVGASVRARLLRLARERGDNYQLLLTRYASERLLYRLARSRHGVSFILKGATLFTVWTGHPYRATRDVDLLGSGDPSEARIAAVFAEVLAFDVDDDGVVFDAGSLEVSSIREDQEYGGLRVEIMARVTAAQIRLQIDVGFGDAVTSVPVRVDLPVLLDDPAPHVLAYSRETVVAEKLDAIVQLGITNSRTWRMGIPDGGSASAPSAPSVDPVPRDDDRRRTPSHRRVGMIERRRVSSADASVRAAVARSHGGGLYASRVGPGTMVRACVATADRPAGATLEPALATALRQHRSARTEAVATRVEPLASWDDLMGDRRRPRRATRGRRGLHDTGGGLRTIAHTARGVTALFRGGPGSARRWQPRWWRANSPRLVASGAAVALVDVLGGEGPRRLRGRPLPPSGVAWCGARARVDRRCRGAGRT